MVGVWGDTEFLLSKVGFLGSWFPDIALYITFIVGFSWIVYQTNWVQNLVHRTSLRAKLVPFPLSGLIQYDPHVPQLGYAKIAISNKGRLLKDCMGTVIGISRVQREDGVTKEYPFGDFTAAPLCWDYGESIAKMDIPNNGVPKMLNLAYLDQNKPDSWQLALADKGKRVGYSTGWYKIDVVVSSQSQNPNALKLELMLGLGDRKIPPSGLNLWMWGNWQKGSIKIKGKTPKIHK
jgi:hypothetical protein